MAGILCHGGRAGRVLCAAYARARGRDLLCRACAAGTRLFGEAPNTWPAELRTKTMQYDHTFFKAHDLLVIQLTEPSGSITHELTGLVREGERLKAAITRL